MTTPAKPERMTDAQIDEDVMFLGQLIPEVACQALARVANELRSARAGEAEAIRGMAEALAERNSARSGEEQAGRERDLLERQIDEFALAIGYGTRPDGQSGVERPSLAYIADLIKDERQEHTEAREFQDWAAEALDQWRAGEEHLGPLDDALTAALDELEAKRSEAERLWDLAEALAHELGRQIKARLETERECATLERELDEALAAYAQAKLDTYDTARELAAAREEAERLKAQIERMKEANNGTGGGTQ